MATVSTAGGGGNGAYLSFKRNAGGGGPRADPNATVPQVPGVTTSRYDNEMIGRFLCVHHGVRDVRHIEPFGKRRYTWEVLKTNTLGVQVGAQRPP